MYTLNQHLNTEHYLMKENCGLNEQLLHNEGQGEHNKNCRSDEDIVKLGIPPPRMEHAVGKISLSVPSAYYSALEHKHTQKSPLKFKGPLGYKKRKLNYKTRAPTKWQDNY